MPSLKTLRTRVKTALVWRRHRLHRARQAQTHPLRYLFLEITRRCNLSCVYCGSNCTPRPVGEELTVPQWIEVVEQVARDFDARRIMVAVTGGEPLIKEGVYDLFDALRRNGFRYGMVSNSTRLDADAARELVRVGIGSISLSMDGPPELNDRLRGPGASAKTTAAIRHLKDAGFRGKLEILSTLTTPTIDTLESMRTWIAAQRVPLWRLAPVMPIGRAEEHPDLVPDGADLRRLLEWVCAARLDGLIPKPEFGEEGFLGARFEGHVRPYLCQCNAGVTVAGVRYDGRIAACPELSDAFDQGDIRKEPLKKVWDERFGVMRDRSWARKGPCLDCPHWDVCQGGALHLYDAPEGGSFKRCFYRMLLEDGAVTRPASPPKGDWYASPSAS